jgi:hypothetical protein
MTQQTCGAWYGEAKLKSAVMDRLREDRRLDRIVQGSYWSAKENRGCHLGCLTRQNDNTQQHTERLFNLPLKVAYWLESVFEGLPKNKCEWWVVEGTDAIAVGADLSLAHHHLAAWLLGDESPSAEGNRHPLVADAVRQVRELHIRAAAGEGFDESAWSAARLAALAALAALSARSARSAEAAAESAAWSAEAAAESAAWSAEAAAESAAESKSWISIAKKSIEIFRASPIIGGECCRECVSASLEHLERTDYRSVVRV